MSSPKNLPASLWQRILDSAHVFAPPGQILDPLTGVSVPNPASNRNPSNLVPLPAPGVPHGFRRATQAPYDHSAYGAGASTRANSGTATSAYPTANAAGQGAGTSLTALAIGDAMREIEKLYSDAVSRMDPAAAQYVKMLVSLAMKRMKAQQDDLLAQAFSTDDMLIRGYQHYVVSPPVSPSMTSSTAWFLNVDRLAPVTPPRPLEICDPEIGEVIAWRAWRYVPEVGPEAGVPVYVGDDRETMVGRLQVSGPMDGVRDYVLNTSPKLHAGIWDRDIPSLQVEQVVFRLCRSHRRVTHATVSEKPVLKPGLHTSFTPITPNQGLLRSLSTDHVWQPGETMIGDLAAKPIWGGTNPGIHARKDELHVMGDVQTSLAHSRDTHAYVIGKVALWGQVIEHEHGYRAENAKVVEVVGGHRLPSGAITALRKRYGLTAA